MGDMADWAVENMMFNSWGEYELPRKKSRPTIVTCRNCYKRGLRWGNVKGGGWRVHERSGGLHQCAPGTEPFSYTVRRRGLSRGLTRGPT